MQVSRRDALMGATAAAVVTAAIAAPLAIKAAGVKAALAGDPVIALIDEHIALFPEAYPDFDQFPEEDWSRIEEQLQTVRDLCDNLLCDVFRTPAESFDVVLAKARLAYRIERGERTNSREPLEDMAPPYDGDNNFGALDSKQLVWSLLNDLERLARSAGS